MVDGMNGLLIGLALFWTGCLLLYAPDHLTIYLQLLMLGLLILLPYNLLGVLFLGDAGSYSIGATIGMLMIYCHNQADGALPMLTVVLWLLVPVLDCLRVMVTRLYNDRSPLSPDENHLHHRLARHWRWPICLVIYLVLVACPGLVGAIWPSATLAMLMLGGTVVPRPALGDAAAAPSRRAGQPQADLTDFPAAASARPAGTLGERHDAGTRISQAMPALPATSASQLDRSAMTGAAWSAARVRLAEIT